MGSYSLGDVLASALGGGRGSGHQGRSRSGSRYERPLGEALRLPHRTGAPVLRNSIEAGTFEHVFFTAPAKGETDRILRAARRILDAGRQLRREARQGTRSLTPAEQLLTTLTAASVRVFEEILTLSRLNRGRVFPSYDHLSDATGLGRATVARAITILERIGFLVRQRRFKRVESKGPGPRYAQTSNAYRAFLPKMVQRYLPRWMRPAPLPVDEAQREQDRQEETEHMLSRLSLKERTEETISGSLGKVLARLGEAIEQQERESQMDTQPLMNSNIIRDQTELALSASALSSDEEQKERM